jgi:hypothetical protein
MSVTWGNTRRMAVQAGLGIKEDPVSKKKNAFRSFRVCLMKLGALTLGAYRLMIIISF